MDNRALLARETANYVIIHTTAPIVMEMCRIRQSRVAQSNRGISIVPFAG